jgi:hypothetical protein
MNEIKMKLKNKQIIEAVAVSQSLANVPMSPRTAYWYNRNMQNLYLFEIKFRDAHRAIVIKHGGKEVVPAILKIKGQDIPNTTGQTVHQVEEFIQVGDQKIKNPKMADLQKDFNELLDTEVEVEIMPLNIIGFNSITPVTIAAIDFMIKDDEEPREKLIQLINKLPKGEIK